MAKPPTGEIPLLIQFASDTAVGLYAEKLNIEARAEPSAGGIRYVLDLVTTDPAGRGAIHMSEAEAQKLRDDLDRALKGGPRLTAVKK
jgi:hypothetical protein